MEGKRLNKEEEPKKKHKVLRVFIIIFIILLVLAIALIGTGYWYIHSKLDQMNYVDNVTRNEIAVDAEVEENLSEYRNIALFGLDTHYDSFEDSRSDCIIIVSINNNTKDVRLLSVYRDTYVDIDGHGLDKITHAYAYGGPALALSTLNKNLDLNITEFVTVNFETVKTIVDEIGGVQITVTSAEANSGSIPNIHSAGTYNLNGEQALAYSRIRKIDTDYQRTERMRTVLDAVFTKVKSLSLTSLNSLLDTMLPHISTNISKDEIIKLMPDVVSYNITESEGWPYNTRGWDVGLWYGIPVTLESNVKELHEKLFGETDYEPTETVKEISDRIVDKTGFTE